LLKIILFYFLVLALRNTPVSHGRHLGKGGNNKQKDWPRQIHIWDFRYLMQLHYQFATTTVPSF